MEGRRGALTSADDLIFRVGGGGATSSDPLVEDKSGIELSTWGGGAVACLRRFGACEDEMGFYRWDTSK